MASCTFFGHSDTPDQIFTLLKATVKYLIESKDVDRFYVGNHGNFDHMARRVLGELKQDFPHIHYAVVLAYMPKGKREFEWFDYSNTIYPEGLETTPLKFAIDKRNKWMISKSDYVISYVTTVIGGAFKYKKISGAKEKNIIELSEII